MRRPPAFARLLALTLALALALTVATTASADNPSPLLVEINEVQPDVFSVYWKAPPTIPILNLPRVEMPAGCTDAAPAPRPGQAVDHGLFKCPGGVRGKVVAIRYPVFNPSVSTIFRINGLDGTRMSTVLDPKTAIWRIPRAETWDGVAKAYTVLGTAHILESPDHLLFLVCLLWIAGSLPRMLVTITGFTLSHSVSLALAALKVLHIPEAPVEICIALSILFLAREAAVGNRASLTWRHPAVISSAFGLLHGLGFAAALMEVGLPQRELVTGLLFFNVGVELGQLAFILALVGVLQALKLVRLEWPRALVRVPIYAVGALSAFWTLRNAWVAFVGPG